MPCKQSRSSHGPYLQHKVDPLFRTDPRLDDDKDADDDDDDEVWDNLGCLVNCKGCGFIHWDRNRSSGSGSSCDDIDFNDNSSYSLVGFMLYGFNNFAHCWGMVMVILSGFKVTIDLGFGSFRFSKRLIWSSLLCWVSSLLISLLHIYIQFINCWNSFDDLMNCRDNVGVSLILLFWVGNNAHILVFVNVFGCSTFVFSFLNNILLSDRYAGVALVRNINTFLEVHNDVKYSDVLL